jgi:hypothetical protein
MEYCYDCCYQQMGQIISVVQLTVFVLAKRDIISDSDDFNSLSVIT